MSIQQLVATTSPQGIVPKLKNLNLSDEVISLTNFLDLHYKNISWAQRLWHIRDGNHELIRCHNKKCNNLAVFGSSKYRCCSHNCMEEYVKQKNLELYGVDNQFKRSSIQDSAQKNNVFNDKAFKKRKKQKIKDNFKAKHPDYEYIGVTFNRNYRVYSLRHIKCGKKFEIPSLTLHIKKKHGFLCSYCYKYNSNSISMGEKEVLKFIKLIYNGKIAENIRSLKWLINPSTNYNLELDIFLPDINLAIEYNGTYNHADPRFYKADDKIRGKFVEKIWDHDKLKLEMCKKKGIKLIVIWEHDWITNKNKTIKNLKDLLINT